MKVQKIGRVVMASIACLLAWSAVGAHAAPEFLLWDTTLLSRALVSDASGGVGLEPSDDNVGAYGDRDPSFFHSMMGDIDGDGTDDFFIYHGTLIQRGILVDESGDLSFGLENIFPGYGDLTWTGMLGDLDGDGTDEFLIQNAAGAILIRDIVPNGSGGYTWGSEKSLVAYGGTGWTPMLANIDGDADDEFVMHRASDGLIRSRQIISYGSGNYTWGAEDDLGNWGDAEWTPLAGDVDGDGTDEFMLHGVTNGVLNARAIVDGGGGDFMLSATIDEIGAWGDTNWIPMVGNLIDPSLEGTLFLFQ